MTTITALHTSNTVTVSGVHFARRQRLVGLAITGALLVTASICLAAPAASAHPVTFSVNAQQLPTE